MIFLLMKVLMPLYIGRKSASGKSLAIHPAGAKPLAMI